MSHDKNVDISTVKACKSGWSRHEDIEKTLSHRNFDSQTKDMKSNYGGTNTQTDVNAIDWCQVTLCNAMGFSRLVRQCDDKTLNILVNEKLDSENGENVHIVSTRDAFVHLTRIKKTTSNKNGNIYNFEGNTMTEIKTCAYGFPDTLFLTQIFNEEKYDSIPNDTKTGQIFSARGMFTTSLYTKKMISDYNYSYWTFCRCCDTTIDLSRHSPGDYKNILINSKLLCIIAFDTTLLSTFYLSFRRLTGGYSRRYISDLIGPSNDSMINGQLNRNNSNVNISRFGISLRNRDVFGMGTRIETQGRRQGKTHGESQAEFEREAKTNGLVPHTTSTPVVAALPSVSLEDLSSTVFDCVLLDNKCDSGGNIILTLLLICKALPHVDYCFEFNKIKVVFSDGYKNFLSCWSQRDTDVAINNNVSLKKMFNDKNQSLFGWDDKTATFKAECIKIESKTNKVGPDIEYNSLVIIVVKTANHHIILYNYDLNNYVILKLNCIININSNKIFPFVCTCTIIVT